MYIEFLDGESSNALSWKEGDPDSQLLGTVLHVQLQYILKWKFDGWVLQNVQNAHIFSPDDAFVFKIK